MTWNVYWGQCAVKYDRILWWNFNSKVEIKDITPKISDNIVQVTVNIHNLMKLDCAKFQLKKEEGKNNFFCWSKINSIPVKSFSRLSWIFLDKIRNFKKMISLNFSYSSIQEEPDG